MKEKRNPSESIIMVAYGTRAYVFSIFVVRVEPFLVLVIKVNRSALLLKYLHAVCYLRGQWSGIEAKESGLINTRGQS